MLVLSIVFVWNSKCTPYSRITRVDGDVLSYELHDSVIRGRWQSSKMHTVQYESPTTLDKPDS